MLRQKGIVKQCPPVVAGNACSKITAEFHKYLLQEIGRSLSTAKNYVPFADQFLMERFHSRTPVLASLRASDVTGFVVRHAHQLSPVRAGIMVTALRSFFRYLLHRGASPVWYRFMPQPVRFSPIMRNAGTAALGRVRKVPSW